MSFFVVLRYANLQICRDEDVTQQVLARQHGSLGKCFRFFQSWNHEYEINELCLSKRYNATTFIEFTNVTNVWKMLQALVVKEQFPRRTMTMLISRTSRHQETSWDMKLLSCLLRPIKIRNFGHLDDFSVFCFGLLYLFVLFAPDLNHWSELALL